MLGIPVENIKAEPASAAMEEMINLLRAYVGISDAQGRQRVLRTIDQEVKRNALADQIDEGSLADHSEASPFSPLINKLRYGADLKEVDCDRLVKLAGVRRIEARRQILLQGDRPESVYIVLDGFACRYKVLRQGKCQIMALLVPGDFSDLHGAILDTMDHGIMALSPCTVAELPRSSILELVESHPRLCHAFRWATLVDGAILREWLVNMALREAPQQMAHLFCELFVRLHAVGVGDANSYPLPLTQKDLAEMLGLTSVHVNRTLQLLRDSGLIVLRKRRLLIPDVARLKAYCDFNPDYLHFSR
ncbi:Crp/Fnr family transcriptional regulator [Methylobacterium sp. J-067]|uniref:Crp/Fnr family transcriptional regulator n=1 Tax=Methylobacterium sp. J-067 TaxID=2836648 RepID=UPI001FB8F096|nr:Crp/Fnr family transcriptional regulator [Methylobacterium sp. J-067]MCJ2023614.1 Crp/Fnr family transcriptional regulator [Methylobacterium sp. J-067]